MLVGVVRFRRVPHRTRADPGPGGRAVSPAGPAEQQPTADEWVLVEEEAEPVVPRPRRRRRRHRRDPLGMARFACKVLLPALCAMASAEDSDHLEDLDKETLQQLAGPEAGKTVVAPSVIRQAVGKDLDAWILAASVEHDSFLGKRKPWWKPRRPISEPTASGRFPC